LQVKTVCTQHRMASGSAPLRTLLPHSKVSGRSVTSRIVTFDTPRIAHSSCTVPESLSVHNAFRSRVMKSKNPNGSRKRIWSLCSESSLNDAMRLRVRGWVLIITGRRNSSCKRHSAVTRPRNLSSRRRRNRHRLQLALSSLFLPQTSAFLGPRSFHYDANCLKKTLQTPPQTPARNVPRVEYHFLPERRISASRYLPQASQ